MFYSLYIVKYSLPHEEDIETELHIVTRNIVKYLENETKDKKLRMFILMLFKKVEEGPMSQRFYFIK
jgi:hypothetical protein